ncbi:MAG: hypothetical protein HGA55_06435 [Methanoregulaceae archaeon]|nr:hypothetical protein [Methanoregulaceae archaeon]
MKSRKRLYGRLALVSGLLIIAGLPLNLGGVISLMVYQALLVLLFPVFVLSLGLWWMAREHEPDIPFLGY